MIDALWTSKRLVKSVRGEDDVGFLVREALRDVGKVGRARLQVGRIGRPGEIADDEIVFGVCLMQHRLEVAEVLRAVKGVHGGYQILKDLSEVSVLELMEAVMGSVGIVNCRKEGKECPLEDTCNVSDSMGVLDDRIKDLYQNTTVLELVQASKTTRNRKQR